MPAVRFVLWALLLHALSASRAVLAQSTGQDVPAAAVDSVGVDVAATLIRSQLDTASRLLFVPEQPLRDALGFTTADVAALRSTLPARVLVADSAPSQPCTGATGYRCTRLSFDSVVQRGETWTFTLTRSIVRGCGYSTAEFDVQRVNGEPTVAASRYGGSGACGRLPERERLVVTPRAVVRPPH